MNLFSRRRPTESTPVGAAIEGDAAIFAWRADLRERLDAQISRATTVTLAAAKSWASFDDPPPKDVYLAQALRDADLWGTEHEPGIHVARWSEEDCTVTLRAWDWDLTRPRDGGDFPPTTRVRTLPWLRKSDQAHGLSAKDDLGGSEDLRIPDPLPGEMPHKSLRDSDDGTDGLEEEHDSTSLQIRRTLPRLQENRAFQLLVVFLCVGGVNTLLTFTFTRNSFTWELELILRILAFYPVVHWLHRRGWLRRRKRVTPTVRDTLTLLQRALHLFWRLLVASLVWGIAMMISIGAGAPSGTSLLTLFVVFLLTVWWYVHFLNRPVELSPPEPHGDDIH